MSFFVSLNQAELNKEFKFNYIKNCLTISYFLNNNVPMIKNSNKLFIFVHL